MTSTRRPSRTNGLSVSERESASSSRSSVTADDLDLEPPIKQRRLVVQTTAVYEIWVDDDEDRGAVELAAYLNQDPCDLGDLIRNESATDGEITVRAPDEWDLRDPFEPQHGPWQVCPFPSCGIVQYPAYSVDTACYKHRVVGCQHRNLPERVFA